MMVQYNSGTDLHGGGGGLLVFNTLHIFAQHYGKINTLPSQLLTRNGFHGGGGGRG